MSTLNTRKKKIGRPSVDSEEVSVRIQRADLDRIDDWRVKRGEQSGRPEAIRRLVRISLDAYRHLDDGLDLLFIGLDDWENKALDVWAKAQPDSPSRPEAIRRLVRKALDNDD